MQSARCHAPFDARLDGGDGDAAASRPVSSVRRSACRRAGTLTIAYNVNLPSVRSDRRRLGGQSDHPVALPGGLRSLYRRRSRTSSFKPGLLTKWGWNADRTKVEMEVREGATWHNGDPVTAEDVVWSLERAGRPEDRQSDPVRLVEDRQLQDRRQQDHRRRAIQFEPTLFKWMAFLTGYVLPKKILRERRRRGLREEAGRLRPVHGRRVPAERVPAPQGQPELLGRQAGLRHGGLQVRPRSRPAASPRSNPAGSDVTFEIPYEEFDRLKGKRLRRLRPRRSPTSR